MTRRAEVADELRAVMDTPDGRTLVEMREAEPHYDVVVEKVEPGKNGMHVTVDGAIGMFLPIRAISVGDVVTIWDGHPELFVGGERHGWALNGELVEWLTPFERIAKRVQWLADYDRRRREEMERGAEQRHRDYESLPAPLKARIDRFAAERPDFWMNGAYELYCCTEAAKIAEYLRPRVEAGGDPEAVVRAFYDSVHDQADCGIDDGHSGNTFGGACSLARALLDGSEV